MKGHHAVRRISEIGIERQCTGCRGFWPEDDEFFARKVKDGPFRSQCKACGSEQQSHRNIEKARVAA